MEHYIYKHTKPFIAESGEEIAGLTIHYSTLGSLNANRDNVIWICHALTANSDVSAWWSGLIGHGKLYDPAKHFIICANILGSCYGTSGPIETNPQTATPFYFDFPFITIRDMVGVHEILRNELKIDKIHTCIGGSLGGQQAMEWAIISPLLIENLVLLATNAFHSPWGIAFNEAQRMAIQSDPTWKESRPDAGREGLKAARAIALLSYRNYQTYDCSQKEDDDFKIDHFKASSYQNYQGEKLVNRFNCHSYWYLTKAMDSHNVGRGRGSAQAALAQILSKTLVIGITTDILFPINEQAFLASNIPASEFKEIESLYGHDGFLIDYGKIENLIRNFYNSARTDVIHP